MLAVIVLAVLLVVFFPGSKDPKPPATAVGIDPAAGATTQTVGPSVGSPPTLSAKDQTIGPGGVVPPSTSVPVSDADRAFCQNRGVLLWLAESATYRGALCWIDNATMLITMSRSVGGNQTLLATADLTGYRADTTDGASYVYDADNVTVTTPSKIVYQEPTTSWKSGTSTAPTIPGDLALSRPISYPPCDGSVMVVEGTSWTQATNAQEVQRLLAANPGSSYMRTDLSCRSFWGPSTSNSGGDFIYAVYTLASDAPSACREIAGSSYYGRWLSNQREPGDNIVTC